MTSLGKKLPHQLLLIASLNALATNLQVAIEVLAKKVKNNFVKSGENAVPNNRNNKNRKK